jgi:DNA-directed RNA polymerase beta subunit
MSGIKSHPLWQSIVHAYFKANNFVKHQIDSYNEFIDNDIQKILNETGPIEIHTTQDSRCGECKYTITFGDIFLKNPVNREHDGTTNTLYPQEARNRSLTYHSALYCDITVKILKISTGEETVTVSREQLGYIPIMLKSNICLLNNRSDKDLIKLNECIYDEGGYFIVNGNEKVIVAQEKMPNNIVYFFYKRPPSKVIWQAEIRSQFEYHTKTTSTMYFRIFSKGSRSSNTIPTFTDIDGIRVQITYIKQDIPVIFLFYALGITNKEDILKIIYRSKIHNDKKDQKNSFMMNQYRKNILKFLRCSFDEADRIIREDPDYIDNTDKVIKTNEVIPQNLEQLNQLNDPLIDQDPLNELEEIVINTEEETDYDQRTLNKQEFALDYIAKKGSTIYSTKRDRINYTVNILNKELLPHLHIDYSSIFSNKLELTKTKAFFIAYVINKLYMCYIGVIKETDRDHLGNKRLELTGNLLSNLFKSIFKRLHKEAKANLTKTIESNNSFDLVNAIKSKSITNDIKYALSTGNWGRQTGGTAPKTGVSQQLSRLTFSSTLSHLRRLNTPLNREGKQAKPRQLHGTYWSYLCPCETPEGQGCGLLKNLAITTHVSIGSEKSSNVIIKLFKKYASDKFIENIDFSTDISANTEYKIFLDGSLILITDEADAKMFVQKLLKFRRKLIIHYDVSICLDQENKELNVFTCAGRCCRPLLVKENLYKLYPQKSEYTWTELLQNGIVEYIDVMEEEELMIAMDLKELSKPETTHMEIHPSMILGICASIIPFCEHNQSPRNIYQSILPEEMVLMADGTSKMIKDIKVGEQVVTFNPKTLERSYSKVINQYVKETENKIYTITTITGRKLTATDNHHFYTNKGFVEVKHFDKDTKLAINLTNNKISCDTKIKILDVEDYIKVCNKYNMTKFTTDKYIEDVKEWFMEIEFNKVSILAGIIGYLLADGYLHVSKGYNNKAGFCHSDEESAKNLLNDMEYLGFGRKDVKKCINTSVFGKDTSNPREITQTTYNTYYYGKFAILLEALGVTYGKRTTQNSSIPNFILNGDKEVQRSFLSGIFGGDGSKVRYDIIRNNVEQIEIKNLVMSKDKEHVESLVKFMEEIKIMLNKFDIDVNYIKTLDGSFGKLRVELSMSNSSKNIIKFYEEIGYKYDVLKNQESGILVEYLKYKTNIYNNRVNEVIKIRNDIDNNMSNKDIAVKYNKTQQQIADIKQGYKRGDGIGTTKFNKDFMSIVEFEKKVQVNSNTLFMPIKSIEPYTESSLISDITVESENHTFIASNFLIHNSSMGKALRD